ncbi:MAG: phosphoenolpyruvate--protein phosphotransferase, partial [Actinomyces sp.]
MAVGRLLVLGAVRPAVPEPPDPGAAFTAALDEVAASLRSLAEAARQADRQEAAEVLDAQALMADDPLLRDAVTGRLDAGRTLDRALDEAADESATMLATVDDPYIAARADDVREVADRVRRHLAGVAEPDLSAVTEPTILVATTITAAETSQLDPAVVLGFATETGGPTSHVAIIARSLGVPAVVGVSGLTAAAADRVDA